MGNKKNKTSIRQNEEILDVIEKGIKRREEAKFDQEKIEALTPKNVSLIEALMLSKNRIEKSYRNNHETFGKAASSQFAITRPHAQNKAQAGDYLAILRETVDIADTLSLNIIRRMAVGTNKIAEQIGVKKSRFRLMSPIIQGVAKILIDISTREDGKTVIKKLIVEQLHEMVANIVKGETVIIEGVQIKVSEIKEQGLLNYSLYETVISQVAEQILAKSEIIKNDLISLNAS